MSPIDEAPSFETKSSAAEGRKPKTAGSSAEASAELVGLTVDAATGRIVKVERVDAGGARSELSETDRARIAGKAKEATLERLLEQAFEAGIDCVLTHARADPEPPESDEDAELSRAVLKSLIEHSAARRLMGREVLSRAIVATLIQQAASAREGPAAH